jgi:hypothetical protein
MTVDANERAAVRIALKGRTPHGKWAVVRRGDWSYVAAQLRTGQTPVVLVRHLWYFSALDHLEAVNGTARTRTALKPSNSAVPKGGSEALACGA